MELLFLGTSAGVPTRSRNVTAILLNLQHSTQAGLWLFDCGEGTQHQMLAMPFNPERLDRIFISHLRGDHLFGLPGLLCSRSMTGNAQSPMPYGPKGLREFTETASRLSGFWTDYSLGIVEITPGEIVGDGLRKIMAYPLTCPLECYGFRIQEHDKSGTLDASTLRAAGVKMGPWFQDLKAGRTIVLENGHTIHGADFLAPVTKERSVAIFGDTGPCASAIELAQGVDVMAHETTLNVSMEEEANSHGHNSTRQAVQLALDTGMGRLIMTHVSSRYGEKGYQRLLAECGAAFPDAELAYDFAIFTVQRSIFPLQCRQQWKGWLSR